MLSKELTKLDENVFEFYRFSARYFDSIGNLYGREIYKNKLKEIENEIKSAKAKNRFEELYLENVESVLRINDLILDFFADPKFSYSVKEMFDMVMGKGSFKFLENEVKNSPYEKRWNYMEMNRDIGKITVSRFTDDAKKLAQDFIPKLKQDTLDFAKEKGYLPKDFDYNIFLLPPRENGDISSWRPETKILNLGFNGFYFTMQNNKTKLNPTKAYCLAFHELLGHGAHQLYSKDLPKTLQLTEDIGLITPTKPVSEGIATYREFETFELLNQKTKELDLTDFDINYIKENLELEYQNRIESIYFGLTKDRELLEKDFDGSKEIFKLTNNPIWTKWFKNDAKNRFIHVWNQLGYVFGLKKYNEMLNNVEKKFGKTYLKENKYKINIAAMKGVWSWEVYPKAVEYFLEKER